jgi:putative ABC transport system permease protein
MRSGHLQQGVPIENIRMALSNLWANKFRSFLTLLGIVIGVMTVIVVASILTGLRQNIVNLIEEYGVNNLWVFHLTTGIRIGPLDRKELARKPLNLNDVEAIRQSAPSVREVGYKLFLWRLEHTMTFGGNTYRRANLQAVSPNCGRLDNAVIRDGRYINEVDDLHRRDVMVIGSNVVDALFSNRIQIVGSQVNLAGRTYEVVGVLEKRRGSFFGENEEDNAVIIPYRTGAKLSNRLDDFLIVMQAYPGKLKEAVDQVEVVLRRQRNVKYDQPNNFDINTPEKIVRQFDSITAAIGLIAIAISGVGLMVGGIGVMNIMLVSVTERTREIGVRKAIGAKRSDIVTQFLFEAMTLTVCGGVVGIFLSLLTSILLMFLLPNLPSTIPLWAVITGLTVSVLIGILFGVWPARVASLLDPIECLRYE